MDILQIANEINLNAFIRHLLLEFQIGKIKETKQKCAEFNATHLCLIF